MNKRQEFKVRIREFNKVVGVPLVHDLAKKLFPDADLMDMGYDGGYSDVLVGNKLTTYEGVPFKEENVPKDLDEYFKEPEDVAFGTIQIETKDGKSRQIYHIGYRGGRTKWYDDWYDDNVGNNDQEFIGETIDVIDYLNKLKKENK